MKTSKHGTKVKPLDYFRVYITWQEICGNGDTYKCGKIFFVKAVSVKRAIKEVTAQWKASNKPVMSECLIERMLGISEDHRDLYDLERDGELIQKAKI